MTGEVPTSANDFIERELNDRLAAVAQVFDADALCIVGDLYTGMDRFVRVMVEDLQQPIAQALPSNRLVVILTTAGGHIEAVKRIVEILRHYYDHVAFVVPDYAFSAGTVLAMSGDEIWMDYFSRLGPIDAQVESRGGRWVSAIGYLVQWERLMAKAGEGTLTAAEFQLMLTGFDQAELYQYEQLRELSVTLLKEWLVNYKFKNWAVTESRQIPVTAEERELRAEEIGRTLNDPNRWHSHGSGIPMSVLREELKLLIDDLGSPARGKPVKAYNDLLTDYMMRLGDNGVLHTVQKYLRVA